MRIFVFVLLKLILDYLSGAPKLPLTQNVSPPPGNKKLFLRLSAGDDELLSKIVRFLAESLPKLHSPFPSYSIP